MLLKNKIVVIFGGSGAIGRAVAHVIAREGAHVYLGARSQERLHQIADDIRAGEVAPKHSISTCSMNSQQLSELHNWPSRPVALMW